MEANAKKWEIDQMKILRLMKAMTLGKHEVDRENGNLLY